MANEIKVTLIKSPIGGNQKQKDTVKTLGLTKLNQSALHEDSPAIRGMINRVSHLVRVEEVNS